MIVNWASAEHSLSGGHRDTAGISLRRGKDRQGEIKIGERVGKEKE